jgi:hypothetical protein
MEAARTVTVEMQRPRHALVWRRGVPTVVTWLADGLTELCARAFDDDYRALAHLAILNARGSVTAQGGAS